MTGFKGECNVVIGVFLETLIKGLSQKELAAKLDKNPNTIASICNNKSQPHLKDLKKIALILDIDIRELLVPTK